MKKAGLILLVAIILAALVVGLIAFFNSRNTPSPGNSNPATGGAFPTLPTSTATTSTPPASAPTGSTFVLGTSDGNVTVNNFYETAAYITTDQQTVVMKDENDYMISYNTGDSSFAITILATPFDMSRQEAEAAFLSDLGVSEADACKLKVYEGMPTYVSDEYPGVVFPLSFCGNVAATSTP